MDWKCSIAEGNSSMLHYFAGQIPLHPLKELPLYDGVFHMANKSFVY